MNLLGELGELLGGSCLPGGVLSVTALLGAVE